MKKGVKITLWSFGGVLLFVVLAIVLALAFINPIAKYVVINYDEQILGRELHLQDLDIHPLKGEVSLYGVECLEQDKKDKFAYFDTLYAQIRLLPLFKKEVVLTHIHLIGFGGQVVNKGNRFNFTDIVEHFSKEEKEEEEQTESVWKVHLLDIVLKDGRFCYKDVPAKQDWDIEHINVKVPGLYFEDKDSDGGLHFALPNDGGNIYAKLSYNMKKMTYSAAVKMNSVKADQFKDIYQKYVGILSTGASVSADLKAVGDLNCPVDVDVVGSVSVANLDLQMKDYPNILKLDELQASGIKLNPSKKQYVVAHVAASGVGSAYRQAGEKPFDVQASGLKLSADGLAYVADQFSIKKIAIDDGSVRYQDNTMFSPFSYQISRLRASSEDFNLTGENHVRLMAGLPKGGSLMADWRGGFDFLKDNEKLTLVVKNLQLSEISPYVQYYTANSVNGGTLSITSENRIHNGVLRGTNVADIYAMNVGKKDHSLDAEYKAIPVKLAVGLLQDLNKKINLNLPVSGTLTDPEFSYKKIIWKTIGNMMLKATVSPFVLLAQAIGAGSDVNKIPLKTTVQPDLTSEQYARVDKLVQMMQEHEELKMVISQQFNLSNAIKEQGEFQLKRNAYEQKYGKVDQLSLADIENIKEMKEQAGSLPSQDSLQAEVLRLADIRSRVLYNYLTVHQGLPAERVEMKPLSIEELEKYSGSAMFDVEGESNE